MGSEGSVAAREASRAYQQGSHQLLLGIHSKEPLMQDEQTTNQLWAEAH